MNYDQVMLFYDDELSDVPNDVECPIFERNCSLKGMNMSFFGGRICHIFIPKSVEMIPMECFSGTPLTSITFEKGSKLSLIDYGAFSESNLAAISIPSSVTNISQCCFTRCFNLSRVVFEKPSQLTVLEYEVFKSCRALKMMELPDSVESIETMAFADCSSLERIELSVNSNLNKIERDAFIGSKLTSFYVPENVDSIAPSAFHTRSLKFFDISPLNKHFKQSSGALIKDGSTLVTFLEQQTHVIVPNEVTSISKNCTQLITKVITFENNSTISRLSDWSFASCGIEKITIPSSVKVLGKNCFYESILLKSVEFESPSTVESFETNCFRGCTFQKFTIPASVKQIAARCFEDCCNLSELTFGNTAQLEVIGPCAFTGTGLTSICLPDSIRIVKSKAFCSSQLTSVSFGEDSRLEELEERCFCDCKLEKVTLPKSLSKLSATSFLHNDSIQIIFDPRNPYFSCADCSTVKSSDERTLVSFHGNREVLIDPETVEIGKSCFESMDLLNQRCIFSAETQLLVISDFAFMKCSIESIVIPKSVQRIGNSVFRDSMLSEVQFANPCSLTHIGESAFAHCYITKITIPSSVKVIDSCCFNSCMLLDTIDFDSPSSITTIGDRAFQGTNITILKVPGTVPEFLESWVDDCPRLRTVHHGKEVYDLIDTDNIYEF